MYRIRSSTGEESSYDSPEAFAQAVHEGQIGPDALIHHARSDRWILVCLNPEYKQARDQLRPVASLEAPPLVEDPPFWQNPVTIRSPAVKRAVPEEEAPLWQHRLLRWGTVAAGVIILSGIGGTIWWRAGTPAGPQAPVATISHVVAMPSVDSMPAAAEAAGQAPATGLALRTPDSTTYWAQPTSGVESAPVATGTLRRLTLDQAIEALSGRMHDDLASIGFYQLLSPSEITIPEKLWHGKRTLQDAGNIFETYRVQVRQTRDELRQLAVAAKGPAAGAAARDEAREPPSEMMETYEMEQVADSLVDSMDRLLQFLLERQSSYSIAGGRLDFDHPEDATRYRALRARCDALVAEDAMLRRPGRRPLAPPMSAIRMTLDSLPDLTGR